MDLPTFLTQSPDLYQGDLTDGFAAEWTTTQVPAKADIVRQDVCDSREIIVLDGHLASNICDPDGKEVCVGLYVGPSIVTPAIARARGPVPCVDHGDD